MVQYVVLHFPTLISRCWFSLTSIGIIFFDLDSTHFIITLTENFIRLLKWKDGAQKIMKESSKKKKLKKKLFLQAK